MPDADDEMITKVKETELKKNSYAIIKQMPCKLDIVEHKAPATSNGNKRVRLVGYHIFTGKKYEDTINCTAGFNGIDVPVTTKATFLLMDVDASSGDISLLDEASGDTKDDVTLVKDPEDPANFDEIGKEVVKAWDDGAETKVEVLEIMGKSLVLAVTVTAA
jgi:translation elongation factor P/translation initiation factor 5A